jgi:phosphoesterase RecJ-like protein
MPEDKELFSRIIESNNILIVCHRNPDADTLGAGTALAFFISGGLNKRVNLFCVDPMPKSLAFLNTEQFLLSREELNLKNFNLIICVDSADYSQTGITDELLQINGQVFTVNIDHHQTNTKYADLNIVQQASATAEIVCKLLMKQKANFTKEISTALLAGIISDTTYFTNAGTTKESMSLASELLKSGANIKAIIKNTWKKNSPEALKIWGRILSQLDFNEQYKIVTAVISREDSLTPEVFEGLANFLTTLYEANIILVMRETPDNLIKCSLRTTKDHIDVSRLAQKFGGGGHAKAAGFSLTGKLNKTEHGWRIV